jgi:hypothetical protein
VLVPLAAVLAVPLWILAALLRRRPRPVTGSS